MAIYEWRRLKISLCKDCLVIKYLVTLGLVELFRHLYGLRYKSSRKQKKMGEMKNKS